MSGTGELDTLLDYTRDKVAVVDASGQVQFVNDTVERLLGLTPEEYVGENAFEYIHPDDRAEVREAFEGALTARGEQSATVTYRHETADGSWVWLESRFTNRTDDTLGGYVVTSRDVTPRIEARKARQTARSRLVELAETVTDVVWLFDADWSEVLFVNDAVEDIYGVSATALEADPTRFLEAIHPDDVDAVTAAIERLSAGEPVDIEYRVNPDRDYGVWVWVRGQPIVEDGGVERIAGFSRDITDRRRRERHLVVMENLLRHNLRNDMTTILGNVGVIDRETDGAVRDSVDTIERVGQRLVERADKQRTVVELLTEPREPTPLDLRELVDGAAAAVEQVHPGAEIEVGLGPCPPVEGVRELQDAVRELLENAVRHAHTGAPTVTVTATSEADRVLLTVGDECPPIPEAEIEVLAGRQEMDEVFHTTGLGLWLVRWAVDYSGGRVTFDREDDGNAVTVSLPVAET